VLECLGLSLACGRVEVDSDVMVARLVRLAFKAPAGAGRLHGRQLLFPHDVEIRSSPRIGSATRVVRPGLRTSRSLNLSCEAETCRARRGPVVRGGDLSCEAETCRARVPLVEN
jgi:hypothetical protein